MPEAKDQCVQAAKGPILPEAETATSMETHKEVRRVTAQVGKPVPDFEASAFIDGGFKNIKLSDYKRQ